MPPTCHKSTGKTGKQPLIMRQSVTEINISFGQCLVIGSYSGLVLFHQDNSPLYGAVLFLLNMSTHQTSLTKLELLTLS